MTRPVIGSPTFRTRTSLSSAICNGVPLGTVIATVWDSDDGCWDAGCVWETAICTDRDPAKTQADKDIDIERTRRNTIQEETSAHRQYAFATDLQASS